MTSKERAALKKQAMQLDSIYQIGKSSLTPQMVDAIRGALKARELIKINVLKNCLDDPKEIATVLSERTGSEVVQVIGKKIVLYKKNMELEEKRKRAAKRTAGMAKSGASRKSGAVGMAKSGAGRKSGAAGMAKSGAGRKNGAAGMAKSGASRKSGAAGMAKSGAGRKSGVAGMAKSGAGRKNGAAGMTKRAAGSKSGRIAGEKPMKWSDR